MVANQGINVGVRVFDMLSSGLRGEICGIYSSSCYCQFDNDEILLLHEGGNGIVPFGIGLREAGKVISAAGLQIDMPVYCNNSYVTVPDAGFKVFVEKEKPLIPSVADSEKEKSNNLINSKAEIQENLKAVKDAVITSGSKNGMGELVQVVDDLLSESEEEAEKIKHFNCFCRKGYKPLKCLLNGIISGNSQDLQMVLKGLIGLGPGLTPSMDDLLVGVLYTLNFSQRKHYVVMPGLEELKNLITKENCMKTSPISAAYLKAAACGEQFSLLEDINYSIFYQRCNANMEAPIERLLSVGSSSGTDMLVGIVLGTSLLLRDIAQKQALLDILTN